jgi:hypothetical protein
LGVFLARSLLSVVETPAKIHQSLGDLLTNRLGEGLFTQDAKLVGIFYILPENLLDLGNDRGQIVGVAQHQSGSLLKSVNPH